jgi:HlyD family secretion protein
MGMGLGKKWMIGGAVALLLLAVVGLRGRRAEVRYQTATADRGEIVQTVGATGALQAVVTVQVGSQVSGIIQELRADFNSVVKKGAVVARLDPSSFEARVAQARANLTAARANVERSRATIEDTRQKYERAKQLFAEDLLPAADLETAKANYEGATAQLEASKAAVTQAQATLQQSEVDLEHTVIRTPIDGVVIARNVDVGQTVAASLQAPVLFVIANDLAQMQVNASIDEADVGKLKPGQAVTFRVDAFPERSFEGKVEQVRLQPTTTQNVVTYNTIISVRNDDLSLMPGLTASVSIETQHLEDVVRIPSAALRFRPLDVEDRPAPRPTAGASPAAPAGERRGEGGGEGRGQWRRDGQGGRASSSSGGSRPATVYVMGAEGPEAKSIVTGATDGRYVEVKEGLSEGAVVITGLEGAPSSGGPAARPTGSNPFNPQFQRRQR